MAKRCRDKGPGFERKCCKLLAEWWGRGNWLRTKNLQVLSRTYRGIQGDICCLLGTDPPALDSEFPFNVECKKQEDWEFHDLLVSNSSFTIEGFWMQCCDDARAWNKLPLLLFTKNYHSVYVAWDGISDNVTYCCKAIPIFEVQLKSHSPFNIATWKVFTKAYLPNWRTADDRRGDSTEVKGD